MREKRLTIMLVRGHGDPVRSFHITRNMILGGATALAALFFVTAGLIGYAFRHQARGADVRTLESRNRVLITELGRIEQNLGQFQELMGRQVARENTLRVLANLNPFDKDIWHLGVGGRGSANDPTAILGNAERKRIASLAGSVDELLRQAELEKDTYSQIESAFMAQKARLDATPSIAPVEACAITAGFGRRADPFTGEPRMHEGYDFSAPRGEPVHATADGVVITAGPYENYGNCVQIDHGRGIVTRYAHNSVVKVKVGQKVKRGDVVGLVGMSGRATAPHCHYEVLHYGHPVNPGEYILPGGVIVD